MNNLQKLLAISGVLLLGLIPVWIIAVVSGMDMIATDHELSFSYSASADVAKTIGGELQFSSFIERHRERVVSRTGNILDVAMTTKFVDQLTKKLLFSTTATIPVNRETGFIQGTKALLFFPGDLEKKNYLVRRFSYLPEEGALFVFDRQEEINGLPVYRFSYNVEDVDWTANYPELEFSENVSVSARNWGCIWVDPCTGIIIRHEEQWSAVVVGGTYSGTPVDVGKMRFSSDTVLKQVFTAQNEQRWVLFLGKVAPGATLLIAGILFVMAWPRKQGTSQIKLSSLLFGLLMILLILSTAVLWFAVDFSMQTSQLLGTGRNVALTFGGIFGGILLVLVGIGGTAVEVYRDIAIRMAPLSMDSSINAIRSLQGVEILQGFRGREPVDIEHLAEVFCNFSKMVHDMRNDFDSIDLNPVICRGSDAVVADARILLHN